MTYAVTHAGVMAQLPNFTPQAFTNSDSANTKKTIATPGAANTGAPLKVVAVTAASTDTSDRIAQLWITRSATSYLLTSITVTALSGSNGSLATINLLSLLTGLPSDNDGQPYFLLMNGDTLQVSFTTQVTTAKEIDVFCVAADL